MVLNLGIEQQLTIRLELFDVTGCPRIPVLYRDAFRSADDARFQIITHATEPELVGGDEVFVRTPPPPPLEPQISISIDVTIFRGQ